MKKLKFVHNQQKIWNSNIWLKKIKKRLQKNIKNIKSKKHIKIETFCAESPLPILLLNSIKNIKILDFGSGSLELPLKIIYDTNINQKIEFNIVESKKIISLYKKALLKIKIQKNIKFNFNYQINFKKKYDIFHISDSFQYVDDWKNFIIKIKKNSPKFILFNNLTEGENPTYDTFQKFYKPNRMKKNSVRKVRFSKNRNEFRNSFRFGLVVSLITIKTVNLKRIFYFLLKNIF